MTERNKIMHGDRRITHAEAAQRCGCAVNSIRKRLRRLRRNHGTMVFQINELIRESNRWWNFQSAENQALHWPTKCSIS